MTLSAGISPRHINTYHHTNSLLFQFILVEFIEIFDEIQRLDALCHRKPTPLPTNPTDSPNPDTLKKIEATLAKLVGSQREYMRLFSWNFGDGLLTKLKTFCALFIQNSSSDEKELLALQHYADKIWKYALLASDTLHTSDGDRIEFLSAIDKASGATQRFAKLIARIILQFSDDENVVLCVLRYKESLDRLYGNRFVFKLFSRMYPKGLRDAHHFLARRYTERGFDNVLPAIADKIAELEVSAL